MNTFKYSSPSTQPSSITLDTLVQEASQKTSHPYLKRKVTHRKTFAKLQNQDSLLRWTKDQLRSESLRIYQDSHPRLHVSSLTTKETNTDNAELFDFFDLQPQKTITQMGRVRYTSPSLETSSFGHVWNFNEARIYTNVDWLQEWCLRILRLRRRVLPIHFHWKEPHSLSIVILYPKSRARYFLDRP